MEYAHYNGSSSVLSVASSSSSSLLLSTVAPGAPLPGASVPHRGSEGTSPCANNHPASSNPWAFCAVWANSEVRVSVVVGVRVRMQRHVQPLTMPRAHNVCEYSLGNRHCLQWMSPNCR